MRNLLFLRFGAALCASILSCSPARAQGDYSSQKAQLRPQRFETVADLRLVARGAIGKIIELKGTVKGTFARGDNLAVFLHVAESENITIEAPAAFRGHAALRPGAASRLLCRVDGVTGNTLALALVNATDVPEGPQLFKLDDDGDVIAPPSGSTLPPPEQIMIGPDAPLSPWQPQTQTGKRKPSSPASRGMLRPASPSSFRRAPSNPLFGFDDNQRAAYATLARRTNPRLGGVMADTIAASILSASQTHNLDPRFLAAIVKVESSFDPYCLSSSGAMGLGQLMPFNLRPLGVSNAWDPMQNLHGAAKLLRQNLDIYARQANGTLLAVAAYHAGVGAVNRAGKQVPPRASTQKYVWKVYYAYRALAPELF